MYMHIPVPLCLNSGLILSILAGRCKQLAFAILLSFTLHSLRYHCRLLSPGERRKLMLREVRWLGQGQIAIQRPYPPSCPHSCPVWPRHFHLIWIDPVWRHLHLQEQKHQAWLQTSGKKTMCLLARQLQSNMITPQRRMIKMRKMVKTQRIIRTWRTWVRWMITVSSLMTEGSLRWTWKAMNRIMTSG